MPRPQRVMAGLAGEALWIAALALGMLLFWELRVSVPAGSVNFLVSGDLFHYFWPVYAYARERLRGGGLPEWNPYQAAGEPFLATLQPGALYPARLLLLVAGVPTAMRISTIAHVLLATLGTWALCRQLGAGRPGAVIGALVFGITFAVPNSFWPSYLEAGAWLPVAAAALARLAARGGWGALAVAGLATGMPIVAGGYQVTLYVAYALAILAVALLVDARRRRSLWTTAALFAAAALLGVATAAPQLLPTLSWSHETARRAGALTDVQIDPFGFLRSKGLLLAKTFWRGSGFQPFYLSVPAALLAVVGFVAGGRFGAVLGLSALGAYLLSFGPGLPWFGAYRWLPGLAMYRFPQRLFTLVAFASAIGAALGTTAVLRARALADPRRRALVAAGLVALVAAALVLPFSNDSDFPWTAGPVNLLGPPGFTDVARNTADGGRALLPADGLVPGLPHRFGTLAGVPVLQDYEPLSSGRLRDFMFAAVGRQPPPPDDPTPYTGGLPSPGRIAHPALLDAAAVGALVVPSAAGSDPPMPGASQVATLGPLAVWRNPTALPRAYLVTRARFVADDAAALAAIVATDFDPRREAVLVGGPDGPEAALADASGSAARPAHLALDLPERVVVDVDVPAPALLVLADAFAGGWGVTVDGAPRRLWQTNLLVRGVVVRPGDRRVEFGYRTPGLRPGIAIAAAAWGALAVAAVVRGRRAA